MIQILAVGPVNRVGCKKYFQQKVAGRTTAGRLRTLTGQTDVLAFHNPLGDIDRDIAGLQLYGPIFGCYRGLQRQHQAAANVGVRDIDPDTGMLTGAALVPCLCKGRGPPEQGFEEVAEDFAPFSAAAGKAAPLLPAWRCCEGSSRGLPLLVPELVIGGTPIWILQYLVSFGNIPEPRLDLGRGVDVGMKLARQSAVGSLDLLAVGVFPQLQRLVVILELHTSASAAPVLLQLCHTGAGGRLTAINALQPGICDICAVRSLSP